MKKCRKCHWEKPLTEFAPDKRNKDGRKGSCRVCDNARWRDWYQDHRLKHLAATNARKGLVFECSQELYDLLLDAQGGVCAICGLGDKQFLAVDHDHGTGQVRGLLCSACNRALGLMADSPERLERAMTYLGAARET